MAACAELMPLGQDTHTRLFRLHGVAKRDSAITAWMSQHPGELGEIAKHWFEAMRNCGEDVREVLHDGHPTACVGDAAFGYVNAFTGHVNVGFFLGAKLDDPASLLIGGGKYMRHAKIYPGRDFDRNALSNLITEAYRDMKRQLNRR